MNSRRVATGVFALALCCVSTEARAQRESGPFAGLFGGGREPESGQTLTLNWSGYGGYDDTVLDDSIKLAADPRFQKSGQYGGASLGLGFGRNAGGNRININGGTSVRAYGATRDISAPTYNFSAGFDLAPTQRTSVQLSLGGSYSSFYQFAPFLVSETGGIGNAPTYGFAAGLRKSLGTSASAGLSQRLSSKVSLSGRVGWNRSRFQAEGSDAVQVDGRSASVRLQAGISRNLGFHVGYGYQEGQLGDLPTTVTPAVIQDLDIGFDFNRALSLSRRTTLGFGSGSTIAQSHDRVRHYQINGRASLTHEIRRTWTASLSYVRGTQFIHGLNDLVSSDAVTASAGGQLASRVQLSTSVGYSFGQIGLESDRPSFGSYTASGRLSVGLARTVGLYAQYMYYRYDVPPSSSAFGELPPRLGRQALTFGLNGSIPFMKDTRSPRGSR